MSPLRTVNVPRFGSRPMSQTNQTGRPPCPRPNKRGNKRARGEATRPALKVKLPNPRSSSLSRAAAASVGWMETTARQSRGALAAAEKQNSQSADGSFYFFSEVPSNKARSGKEKAKLSVLRTISKMLEENHLIRQRLAALCQTISGS